MEFGWADISALLASTGIAWPRAASALGVLVAVIAFRGRIAALLCWPFVAALARIWSMSRDDVRAVLRAPGALLVVMLGLYLAARILPATGEAELVVGRVMRTLVVLAITVALAKGLAVFEEGHQVLRARLGDEVVRWGLRLVVILIWLVGLAAVLEVWGVQVAPLLASLGILGVAVALGAQDFFKNLISGFVVLSEKRYRIGDRIQLPGVVDGMVEEVGFRSTRVRLFDGAPTSVPNAMLSDGALVNYGEIPWRRILMHVGLEYGTTAAQLRQIREEIANYLRDSGDFVPAETTTQEVRIDRFSDSSIDLMIYCFANTAEWAPAIRAKEKLILRIKDIVEGAGTGFAFPSRSIYIEKGAPNGPSG